MALALSRSLSPRALLLPTLLAAALAGDRALAMTFYSSQASFAAVSTTTLQANFESQAGAVRTSPIAEGVVTFASNMSATPFYVLKPGNPGDVCCTFPHVTSSMLSGNGNEDFDLTFSGPAPTAVGFNYTVNNTGITLTYYDAADVLLGTMTLSVRNSYGFLGAVSSTPIARVHFFSLNLSPPSAQNSALDNVYVGTESPTPALPASWGRVKVTYR